MQFSKSLFSLAIIATLTGCNSETSSNASTDNNSASQSAARVSVPVDSSFTSVYRARVNHNADVSNSRERKARDTAYFEGTLTAKNLTTGDEESFDWPITIDENGKAKSEKTVTVFPGTYDFTLVVTKGSQQYTSVLTSELIEDEGEYRLNMDMIPIAGETVVNIDSIKNLSRLRLEFPAEEFINIAAPQIGLIIDGVETVYEINKQSGLAEIILNLPDGIHSYDVNLYDGNTLIGRSKLGAQSLDLVQGDDLNIDIISLQADITIDFADAENARFVVNIPEEAVTDVGGMENLKLLVRITDGDDVGAAVQEAVLDVQEVNGQYFVEHIFDETTNNDIATYIEFRDMSSGTAETIATCSDSVTVLTVNTMACGIGIPKDYIVGGNLLATLAVNVLDDNKVAVPGASVFVDGILKGVTGSNFGTDGFIKTHVKAGEEHTIRAEKDGLEDSRTLTPGALGIHNFDLILADQGSIVTGMTCKSILDAGGSVGSGLYTLDVDGAGPLDSFTTWCDMETNGGGWTLVQNRVKGTPMSVKGNLTGPLFTNGTTDFFSDREGAITDAHWNALRSISNDIQVFSVVPGNIPDPQYTTIEKLTSSAPACNSWEDAVSLLEPKLVHYEASGCNFNNGDYTAIGTGATNIGSVPTNLISAWITNGIYATGDEALSLYLR